MSNNKFAPQYFVVNGESKEAPLLDTLMDRSKEAMKADGIDIDKLSEKTNPDPRFWEELDAVFVSVRDKLCAYLLQITQDYAALASLPLDNLTELAVVVNAFQQDMDGASKKLLEIRARHAGREHTVADDDYTLFIAVFNDYAAMGENVALAAAPVIVEMTDFTLKAQRLITEQEKAAGETSKDVVTDVEFKEVKND